MAATVTATAAKVAPTHPDDAVIRSFIAAVAITAGQAVYITTAGKIGVADANDSGKEQCRGIALEGGGAGQAISVLLRGDCAGFDLTTVAYDGLVYLSDTAGELYDTAGTKTVVVGRCMPLTDSSLTKVLAVFASPNTTW